MYLENASQEYSVKGKKTREKYILFYIGTNQRSSRYYYFLAIQENNIVASKLFRKFVTID